MNLIQKIGVFVFLIIGLLCSFAYIEKSKDNIFDKNILVYEVDLNKQDLKFYWKDENGNNISNFKRLKKYLKLENEQLIFAVNGGMYLKDKSPQGLYIEKGIVKSKMDTIQKAYGNFYLQPNGIFYITKDKKGGISTSINFSIKKEVEYATQSGPMLIIDGKIHSKFRKGSSNLNIRNGVGILPNGNCVFAMSKEKINFYDFASFFKSLGCKNALYLDGFVSRTYLPKKDWISLDGSFGVIIAESRRLKN